jgi:hypothetical protein
MTSSSSARKSETCSEHSSNTEADELVSLAARELAEEHDICELLEERLGRLHARVRLGIEASQLPLILFSLATWALVPGNIATRTDTLPSEWGVPSFPYVSAFNRNAWPRSTGIPGRNRRNPRVQAGGLNLTRVVNNTGTIKANRETRPSPPR